MKASEFIELMKPTRPGPSRFLQTQRMYGGMIPPCFRCTHCGMALTGQQPHACPGPRLGQFKQPRG